MAYATLSASIHEHGIASVALPPLGCGNGGLDWDVVRREIEWAFDAIPEVECIVYKPTAIYHNALKGGGHRELDGAPCPNCRTHSQVRNPRARMHKSRSPEARLVHQSLDRRVRAGELLWISSSSQTNTVRTQISSDTCLTR